MNFKILLGILEMKRNRVENNTFLNRLIAVPEYLKLLRKYNTLEAKYEELRENVKEDVFKDKEKFIELQSMIEMLNNENYKLKSKVKELKKC